MAKVSRIDGSLVSGKMVKKSNEVHRTRNGAEHKYEMQPYKGAPSPKQKAARALHGKVTTLMNPILGNPEQMAVFEKERREYNRTHSDHFETLQQYIYHKIKQQVLQQQPLKSPRVTASTPLPRGVTLLVKPFAELSAPELYEILKARFRVFVLEQGIRYLDEDGIDLTATHVCLRRKGQVIAYARLFADQEDGVMRVGRMLTTDRGKGLGRILLLQVMAEAKRQGAHTLRLHAQQQAIPFYRHFRFKPLGDIFTEAGIPHQLMTRSLPKKI